MKLDSVNHVAIIGMNDWCQSVVLFTGNSYKTTMLAINDKEAASGEARYKTYYEDLYQQ